jgi:hypothetical protein
MIAVELGRAWRQLNCEYLADFVEKVSSACIFK